MPNRKGKKCKIVPKIDKSDDKLQSLGSEPSEIKSPMQSSEVSIHDCSSSSKKRGRPKKIVIGGDRSDCSESFSDETPVKMQKVVENLDISNLSISSTKSGSSDKRAKNVKGKKGFQKAKAVRSLFSPSQELMPPPIVTKPSVTVPDLTPPILTSKLEKTIPLEDNASLTTLDTSSKIAMLEKILGESHLSDIDFPVFGETPLLTACGLAAYLSYLCSITELKCIAVHPNFSGNSYAQAIILSEMQASNFLLNPGGHSMESVAVVFLPILLLGEESKSYADLQGSVGHWVLGVYHTGKVCPSMPNHSQMRRVVAFLCACTLK
uniref:Uncharacterized protein n=1 Tax=Romanomermis culicivorax TaxID=13658 RepID=A0A915IYB2_ROMCU